MTNRTYGETKNCKGSRIRKAHCSRLKTSCGKRWRIRKSALARRHLRGTTHS